MNSSLEIRRTVRALCLGGASTLSIGALSAPALAADDSQPMEEIIVSGLRASLQKSLDIKKSEVGVVDAISSEDIGKFPDSNVAAAMMRIPGVTVSRGATVVGGVPTSTGDATQVTVRGFGPTFNETLFDGRRVATGIGNRGFDFSAVGADFISQVNVLKTPDATLSAGAIGATVNILYPKPFDHPGLRTAASVNYSKSDGAGSASPTIGALFSDTFAGDTFGVLADFIYTHHKSSANHVNVQGWEGTLFKPSQLAGGPAPTPGEAGSVVGWFIQDYGIYQELNDEQRVDGRLVLQFRPSDNLEVTLNDNYAKDRMVTHQWGYSSWFNGGSLQQITQSPNGTVTDFVQAGSPTDFQGQINQSALLTNDTGLNLKWKVSDRSSYEFDYDHAVAKLNPDGETGLDVDVGYGPSGPGGTNGTDIGVTGICAGCVPYVTNYGPNNDKAQFINNGLIGSHVLPMTRNENVDTINQFKLAGTYAEDKTRIGYGVSYMTDRQELNGYSTFANNNWQAYSGYGPASNNAGGVALDQSWFTGSFSTAGFLNGFNSSNLPPNILKFDPITVLKYLNSLNGVGANPSANFNGTYQLAYDSGAHEVVEEHVAAFFLNFATELSIADRPLKVNAGVREERTTLFTEGNGQLPTALTVQPGDHTAFIVTKTAPGLVRGSNAYNFLLPNLDLNYSLTDKLKARVDVSRSLTRPPLANIKPTLDVPDGQRVGALKANGNNSGLLPFLSDNIDLGLEYYYARNSYVSGDAFIKDVTNFIVGGTRTSSINGVIDPTTGAVAQFAITSQVNGPSAQVRGFEFAVQHVFGDSGFGLQANATFVNTNRPYNAGDISLSGFAVTGLANSWNVVGFWEKYGWMARLAVNHRNEYLDHFGQQQNNSLFGSEPTFVDAATYVDFSGGYEINRNFSITVEGLNLTNETYSTHGRFQDQVLDIVDNGRRYSLGVHVKF